MVNMCHYTEIPESLNRDVLYSALKLRDGLASLSILRHRGGKRAGLREELRSILASDRAREPQEL